MDFEVEISKNREKKRFQKLCFFRLRFSIDFGRVREGFWDAFGRGFGACWALLGVFLASFFKALCPRGLKRPQETPKSSLGLDFGWIWRGFERGLGGSKATKLRQNTVCRKPSFRHTVPTPPRGAQELSWARFWVDLEGFREGSGRILEIKFSFFWLFPHMSLKIA